tara:strand:+ start:1492 stop:2124 length:633 start_codon:yes stop_codon:yes gene_type:complete
MSITPETYGNDPKVLQKFVEYLQIYAVSKKTGKQLGTGSIKTYKSNAGSFLKSYGNIELKYLMEQDYIDAVLEYDHQQSTLQASASLKKSHHGILHLQDMYRYHNKKEGHETEKDYCERIYQHKHFDLDDVISYEIDHKKIVSTDQWVREYLSKYEEKKLTKKEMFNYILTAVDYIEEQKTRSMYTQWNMIYDNKKKRKLEAIGAIVEKK